MQLLPRRSLFVLMPLAAGALACGLPTQAVTPTSPGGAVKTSVVKTLTAAAPILAATVAPAVSEADTPAAQANPEAEEGLPAHTPLLPVAQQPLVSADKGPLAIEFETFARSFRIVTIGLEAVLDRLC
jgi:hypothetical protein